jgi:hypothetical protein
MLQTAAPPARTPALWPYLLLCAGVALVVTLGDFHRGHTADTLLPILVSQWPAGMGEKDQNSPGAGKVADASRAVSAARRAS